MRYNESDDDIQYP